MPTGLRGPLLLSAASFQPNPTLETSFAVGEVRAALAEYWEARFGTPIPMAELRSVLAPPIDICTVVEFHKFALPRYAADIDAYLAPLVQHLAETLRPCGTAALSSLFGTADRALDHFDQGHVCKPKETILWNR